MVTVTGTSLLRSPRLKISIRCDWRVPAGLDRHPHFSVSDKSPIVDWQSSVNHISRRQPASLLLNSDISSSDQRFGNWDPLGPRVSHHGCLQNAARLLQIKKQQIQNSQTRKYTGIPWRSPTNARIKGAQCNRLKRDPANTQQQWIT